MKHTLFFLALIGLLFAIIMSMLSAYIRLGDSGIECEPWPECFEYSFQVDDQPGITIGEDDPNKGARMLHRMLASIFGLLMVGLFVLALWYRRSQPFGVFCPIIIFIITVVLSLVGMVTPDLEHPAVATTNMVGGMLLAALLYWYLLNFDEGLAGETTTLMAVGMVMVAIVTGAWVSANFAATGCDGLFSCRVVESSPNAFNPARILEFDEDGLIPGGQEGIILLAHQVMGLVAMALLGYVAVVRVRISSGRSLLPIVLTLSLIGVIVAEQVQRSVELASLHNIFSLCLLLILIQQYRRWDSL